MKKVNQPKLYNNNKIFCKMQNTERSFIEILLKIVMLGGVSFMTYSVLGIYGMVALVITFASLSILLYRKWKQFRQRGLIASCQQKLRKTLLQRSLLDIFRDLVYFPYVTKIIGLAITIATTKPHPQKVPQILKTLPPQVYEAATKKGLLSLAPSTVESLVLPELNKQLLPASYGQNDSDWDRIEEYHKIQQPAHEQTLQKRVIIFLDGKFGWLSVLILLGGVLAGAHHMNPRKFKRMIIQNGTYSCLVLSLIALVIKVRRHTHKKNRTQSKPEIVV